jgi:hypothetical protein
MSVKILGGENGQISEILKEFNAQISINTDYMLRYGLMRRK